MTEKERNLLAGCIRGDKASWDEFVSQYSALIYHTIKKTFSIHHAEPNIGQRRRSLSRSFPVARER